MKDGLKEQKQFFAEIAEDPDNFEELNECPWCKGKSYREWGEQSYPGFISVQCEQCHIVYVRRRLNERARKLLSDGYMFVRQRGERAKQRQKMYKIDLGFIDNYIQAGKVLDIGCGGGYLLELMLNENWEKWGTELGSEAVSRAKKALQTEKIFEGEIEQIELPPNYFDLIIVRGVIEHVPYPKVFMKRIAELIACDGWLFMSGPNMDSFCANFYKDRWRLHYPEAHLFHFSVKILCQGLEPYGFSLVSDVYHYLETPYASPEEDILQISRDILSKRHQDIKSMSKESPPFFGNRYTAIWKKR